MPFKALSGLIGGPRQLLCFRGWGWGDVVRRATSPPLALPLVFRICSCLFFSGLSIFSGYFLFWKVSAPHHLILPLLCVFDFYFGRFRVRWGPKSPTSPNSSCFVYLVFRMLCIWKHKFFSCSLSVLLLMPGCSLGFVFCNFHCFCFRLMVCSCAVLVVNTTNRKANK